MQCLLCPKTIDETKSFGVTISGKAMDDLVGQAQHQAALSTWTHIALSAVKSGVNEVLLSGHVCSDHQDGIALVAITKGKKP